MYVYVYIQRNAALTFLNLNLKERERENYCCSRIEQSSLIRTYVHTYAHIYVHECNQILALACARGSVCVLVCLPKQFTAANIKRLY